MVTQQVHCEEKTADRDGQLDPAHYLEIVLAKETFIALTLIIVTTTVIKVLVAVYQTKDGLTRLQHHSDNDGDEHTKEGRVVQYADVIIDPNAVVIEFAGAPIAPLTVFRVAQNVAIAYIAEETELSTVKDDLCGSLLFQLLTLLVGPFKVDRRVGRITLSHDCRRHDHSKRGE